MIALKPLILSCMVVALFSSGCASKSEVITPTAQRAPTSPDAVQIYEKQPKKYELLGVVKVPVGGEVRWDQRGHAQAGFAQLKQQAAALGANGLLLQVPEDQSEFTVLAGDGERFYQIPMKKDPRTALAQAIFVIEEK